jgi:phage gpG-like protein
MQNIKEPLREIGKLLSSEMQRNIEDGGRPEKWPPSIRVQKTGGQTLRDTGALMNSIPANMQVEGTTVSVGPGGTAARYAAIQARGGTIEAKNKPYLRFRIPGVGWVSKKKVMIPARDYTYIPPEAQDEAAVIVRNHLLPG